MAQAFHEYRHVRQVPNEPQMRWFQSDYFELFVWFNEGDDTPITFRLCYDRGYQERAITWERATGHLRHDAVDEGGGALESLKSSPVLVAERSLIPAEVVDRFQQTPGAIPADLRNLIIERLSAVRSSG